MKKIDDPLLENLSPRAIREISEKIKYQIAEPEDAVRLMLLFCDLVKNDKEIPKELKDHFVSAFKKIANNELSADRALGIKKTNNRPKADEGERIDIALEVLKYRLKGKTYKDSVEIVAAEKEIATTKVKDSWRQVKEQAMDVEIMDRYTKHLVFSEREKKLINKMFEKRIMKSVLPN